MSRIDKLQLRGIRAFGSGELEEIRFGTPLTLIVGHNGSGKTTIIEALKYATCGIMPPTSRARGTEISFLHDPDLNSDQSTQAQIRLGIKTANGATVQSARNMSITTERGKRKYATSTCSIKVFRDSESTAETVTVAAMNAQMPAWLGVSPAVLDKVIFCHQDESLWPLLPPKDLKPHFDELFEISKYADVISKLKNVRNVQREKLGLYQKDEQHFKEAKTQAVKAEKSCKELGEKIEEAREQIRDHETRITEAEKKAEEASLRAGQAHMIVGTLNGKRIEMNTKQQYIDSLRRNLNELEDSDEALETMLSQYEERVEQYQAEAEQLQNHSQSLQQQISQSRIAISDKERQAGASEAQYQSHLRQMQNRKTLVKDIAQRQQIRGVDADTDEKQIQRFMSQVSNLAKDQNASLEDAKRLTRAELQRIQQKLDGHNEQRATLNARKNNAKQQSTSDNRKIQDLQSQYDSITIDEGTQSVDQLALDRIGENLANARKNFSLTDWPGAFKASEAELQHIHEAKEGLEVELSKATDNLRSSMQFDDEQKKLDDTEQRLRIMVAAHKERIQLITHKELDASTIDHDYQEALADVVARLHSADEARSAVNRELELCISKLETRRADHKNGEAAVKAATAAVSKVTVGGPEAYDAELEQLEEARNTLQSDSEISKEMLRYWAQVRKDVEQHKVCRTCTRGLRDQKEIDAITRSIKQLEKRYDSDQISTELAEAESQLTEVKKVSSHMETWKHWTETELPALKAQIVQLEAQRVNATKRLEAEDMVVDERMNDKRDVEAVSKTVKAISELHAATIAGKQKIKELGDKLTDVGLSRSLKEINDDREKLTMDERSTRAKLEKVRNDKDKKEKEITNLQLEFGQAERRLESSDRELKHKTSLAQQIEEAQTAIGAQAETVRQIDQTLQTLHAETQQAQEEFNEASSRGADRERELQALAAKITNDVNQLQNANKDIEEYLAQDGPAQLELAQQEMERLKNDIAALETEHNELAVKLKKVDQGMNQHNETRRTLDENLSYRRENRALQVVKQEVQDLQSRNAEKEYREYDAESKRWKHEVASLRVQQGKLIGQAQGLDDGLEHQLNEYEQVYKGAARKYREAHVHVETTKACMSDLEKYTDALDKAIMKFHSIKMAEINTIIDELWRKTYQGTDVDTISIRSDAEASNNKNYNYRVCMLKQSTEMDMRGRCSAGQKVLACIIIRLALAEVFGINCGLIALDEPTTNLDRDNIEALAVSLAELINVRKAQKNFQLIVITHDEEFLKHMNPAAYVDSYYRVSRNNRQKSRIQSEQISYLMRA